jgi:hypothetical protein
VRTSHTHSPTHQPNLAVRQSRFDSGQELSYRLLTVTVVGPAFHPTISQSIHQVRLRLADREFEVRFPAKARDLRFSVLGPNLRPSQWILRTIFSGIKRPGREADHSSLSSAEDKNAGTYTFPSPYVSMFWCLIKHRDFTFHLWIQIYCTRRRTECAKTKLTLPICIITRHSCVRLTVFSHKERRTRNG